MSMRQISSEAPSRYTSRILKGGALFGEMRQLVHLWNDESLDRNKSEIIRVNPLNKTTRSRLVDILNRVFIPRFVQGPVPEAWRLLLPLEELEAPTAIIRPVYFWLTALAEPLIYDFCTEYIPTLRSRGLRGIEVPEAAAWIQSKRRDWSDTVTIKVTRSLLVLLYF